VAPIEKPALLAWRASLMASALDVEMLTLCMGTPRHARGFINRARQP
jgi:hypothetical protein